MSLESYVKSQEYLTSSLESDNAREWEGSKRFFFSVPKCQPARTTFKPSKDTISSGAMYNSSPKKTKFPLGILDNDSSANLVKFARRFLFLTGRRFGRRLLLLIAVSDLRKMAIKCPSPET